MKAFGSVIITLPFLVGLACGVFLADAIWWHKSNGVMAWIESVSALSTILYTPAFGLFYICHAVGIGPSGDDAWNMLPWCVIAQWMIIGLIISLVLKWRNSRKQKNA